ncbi:MAG TPA: histidine phosphatase family protein [Zeimonas sp.]|nr:histidine phosphatase family protein [Zeimonas sp.]
MSIVYLVRHAQASFGAEDYDALSELGFRQAHWLGRHFADRGLRFARTVSGTMLRQQDTARAILEAMGESGDALELHEGLNEYPGEALYTAHTGLAPRAHQLADARDYWRTFRHAMLAWAEDRLPDVPETWPAFGTRVRAAIELAVRGTARDDAVLVVSSGGAIGRLVADLMGAPASTAIELNLQCRNTGFTELIAGREVLRLLSFNNVAHLDTPERRSAITFA